MSRVAKVVQTADSGSIDPGSGLISLLVDPSPCLRFLVLRELVGRSADDPETTELFALRDRDPLARSLLDFQKADGSWQNLGDRSPAGPVRATSYALACLGYLGFDRSFPPIARGAAFLFAEQKKDGSWPLEESEREGGGVYSMIPFQTAFPLRGLAMAGFAADPRAERAFDWLLDKRLSDGAWPAGAASGVHGYVAGYRRLPHSRWGCRTNTTAALACLARHPTRRLSAEARAALDHLLARETRERYTLGLDAARLAGYEPHRGSFTYFARFDLALLLDLCARIGAAVDDERIESLIEAVQGFRSSSGMWQYAPNPRATAWVSFDIMRSLARIRAPETDRKGRPKGEWVSLQPRTPFRAYPRPKRRY